MDAQLVVCLLVRVLETNVHCHLFHWLPPKKQISCICISSGLLVRAPKTYFQCHLFQWLANMHASTYNGMPVRVLDTNVHYHLFQLLLKHTERLTPHFRYTRCAIW